MKSIMEFNMLEVRTLWTLTLRMHFHDSVKVKVKLSLCLTN
jgi:hypothetical protein